MASEHYKCKGELAITDIEEAEAKHNACGTFFNIHDILIGEIIKEEATEDNPISEYVVSNECLENNGNRKFDDSNSSEIEVMLRDGVEDPTESKFSPVYSWENMDYIPVIVKNEDHFECTEGPPKNCVKSKTETLKTEYDIDIIYEDVKPQICEEKSSGNNENEPYLNSLTDISIGTGVGPNFSIDSRTWPQQSIEEDGTVVERDSGTRKAPTITIDSSNCPIIQNCPPESKQEFKEIPHTGGMPFQCKSCSKSFTVKHNLLGHERTHTGQEQFECKYCTKSFTLKAHLTVHKRVHTGEKPFQCKVCLKLFSHKNNLTIHERVHTGEKPFQCKTCLKLFSQKASLVKHVRVHTGEKPFQCKVCLKLFSYKNNLTIHERVHTAEKPFQCKICLKLFSQKTSLVKHERVHTKKKTFSMQNLFEIVFPEEQSHET